MKFSESDVAKMTARPTSASKFHREISKPRRPKYGNHAHEVGAEKYRSKRELTRHRELLMLVQAGKIENLRREVPYIVVPSQRRPDGKAEREVKYVADFVYDHFANGFRETRVEDVKGVRTKDYIIKRKLMLKVHRIEIVEV